MPTTGPWFARVQVPVSLGPDALRNHLASDSPSENDQVVNLFQLIYTEYKGDVRDALFEEVFNWVPNSGYKEITWIGVFARSVKTWDSDPWNREDVEAELNCSPITKLIWNKHKDLLYDQGAIYVCAEYGLDALLNLVIAHLVKKRPVEKQVEILFRPGPEKNYTPLGVAIWKRSINCIDTLVNAIGPAAKEYIRKHVHTSQNILGDDSSFETLIHQTLAWARESASVGDWRELPVESQLELLRAAEPMLQKVIDIEPQFLTLHNAEGVSPYRAAQAIRVSRQERFPEFDYKGLEQIIRRAIFRLDDVDDVLNALYSDGDQAKEVCLDLSDFNYDSHEFEVFVEETTSFPEGAGKCRWEFEDSLLFLFLPKLRQDHDEQILDRFLQCLYQKDVRVVNKLRLPDTGNRYSGRFIARSILSRFQVRDFDWVRLEADIRGLSDDELGLLSRWRLGGINTSFWVRSPEVPVVHERITQENELKRIHLYSQRGFPALDQFEPLSANTLLEKIEVVELHVVHKIRSKNGTSTSNPDGSPAHADLQSRVDHLNQVNYDSNNNVTFVIGREYSWEEFVSKPKPYDPARETSESKVIEDLEACHNFISALRTIKPPTDEKTKRCVAVFNPEKGQRVKIAILDNGFDLMGGEVSSNVASGRSFVKVGSTQDGPYLPWYTAADAHGTQMAHLIRSVNPWCRLYPARVACLKRDVDADAAAKAVDWAVAQGVDIISISWIVTLENPQLKLAIHAATQKGILVFCSTADFGAQSAGNIWPAHYENIIAVSASNSYGLPRAQSDRDVHVMFHGDQIRADGPRFIKLDQDTRASGSSVSTALASGLASLCLFLARMANTDRNAAKFRSRDFMLAICRNMQASDTDRVLIASKIFNSSAFEPDPRFQYGEVEPPKGLWQFRYRKISPDVEKSKSEEGRWHFPRRQRSRSRRV